MSCDEIHELERALLEFIKRAAKEGATAEEVKALPEVVQVLKWLIFAVN